MALFLLNPALYANHKTEKNKQKYFFTAFRSFADNYYHFNITTDRDAFIYFMSLVKEPAGEANICGGAGRISNATKKEFKSRYQGVESNRAEMIDDFQAKYRARLATGKDALHNSTNALHNSTNALHNSTNADERLFLGVTEIWKKLDQAAEIVASSRWADVLSRSYDDETFVRPIPSRLEKHLVPFAIRNRAWQKHLNANRTTSKHIVPDEYYEEEEEPIVAEKPKPIGTEVSKTRIVIPVELLDDDW